MVYPFTYWSTSWLLPSFGNYEEEFSFLILSFCSFLVLRERTTLKGPWDISKKNVKWIIWYVKLFEKRCQVIGIYSYTLAYGEWINIISIDIPKFMWNFSHLICPVAILVIILIISLKYFMSQKYLSFLLTALYSNL